MDWHSFSELCGPSMGVLGQPAPETIAGLGHPERFAANQIIWVAKDDVDLTAGAAAIILVSNGLNADAYTAQHTVVTVPDAKLTFARVAAAFQDVPVGIHETAVVHETAILAPDVSVGAGAVIDARAKIGAGSRIAAGAVIGSDVRIGEDCHIGELASVGPGGSGYVRDENGDWERFPQLGSVVLEDHVDVGTQTYIARGALLDTWIGTNAKIGLSVCIGHNVRVGRNSLILANTIVAGSVVIGEDVIVSIGASIRNGRRIGDGSQVGMGAVVAGHVREGAVVFGPPATERANTERSVS